MRTIEVSKEKIAFIRDSLNNLCIEEKAYIIEMLVRDIDVENGIYHNLNDIKKISKKIEVK